MLKIGIGRVETWESSEEWKEVTGFDEKGRNREGKELIHCWGEKVRKDGRIYLNRDWRKIADGRGMEEERN